MHAAIEQHREGIAGLCRHFRVRRLEIFGSAARGADFDPAASDADFLVAFEVTDDRPAWKRSSELTDALENLLGRRVDLVDPGSVENPYILASINRSRELVYGA
jgi:predicted nucleotidyltransferase